MPEQKQQKAPAFNHKVKDAIAALKAENNPKNLNVVINELVRSPLLVPAVFDLQGQPAPKPAADGRVQLPKDTKISLVMVNSPEGKHYYLAFSDWDAVRAWKSQSGQQIIVLSFDDIIAMAAKNTDASGLVINPGENSLRLETPLLVSLKQQRDAIKAQAAAAQQGMAVKPGDKITLVEPTVYPDALVDPVCEVLAAAPGVGSAYLQIMIVNETARSYLLVLDGPKDNALFTAVAKAAHTYLMSREKKMNLQITTSVSALGQQGMRDSEPFYRKGIGRVIEEDDDE